MAFNIKNQIPVALASDYADPLRHNGDPFANLNANVSEKLFTNAQTVIEYNNQPVTPDNITELFKDCTGEKIDPNSEQVMRELLSKTVLSFTNQHTIPVRLMYAQMAAERAKLPAFTSTMIYTASSDVIPSAKNYLAGVGDSDSVFASLAYTYQPQVLGFGFRDVHAFNDFKSFFTNTYVKPLTNSLSSDTLLKCHDFDLEQLTGLTDNLQLRLDDNEQQEPFSFARILVMALYQYAKLNQDTSFPMPFDIGENYNPRALILVNVDMHAHSTPGAINTCWSEINSATHHPLRSISTSALRHLDSVNRAKNVIDKQIDTRRQKLKTTLVKYQPFASRRPSNKATVKAIMQILKRIKDVNQSDNVYKVIRRSFNRPNRRHPDNCDLPGKIVSTQYKPDIHIYLDTSGSISQDNYESGIKLCIALAKKLDVNLYFNSFSDQVSPGYKLPIKGKSIQQIYARFEVLPKVGGGTDFSNVWQYINAKPQRQRELSLLITDFGDRAPSFKFKHPNNLYYLPIDNYDFDDIRDEADAFLRSMINCGHNIRSQILL